MRGFARFAAAIAVFFFCFASLPASSQTTGAALDDASLKTMLDGLGYEIKPLSKGFLVTSKVDTWSLYVQAVLSPDGTKLGLNEIGRASCRERVLWVTGVQTCALPI